MTCFVSKPCRINLVELSYHLHELPKVTNRFDLTYAQGTRHTIIFQVCTVPGTVLHFGCSIMKFCVGSGDTAHIPPYGQGEAVEVVLGNTK